MERDVETRTRDGVILRSDIYRPDAAGGPFPAILVRTPYGKGGNENDPYLGFEQIVEAGYVIVGQDVRGRF
ncbi:MAG: esterase, partial [Chloroflexi bacterium]|nr:esterase [Chloroflexota bacterium]